LVGVVDVFICVGVVFFGVGGGGFVYLMFDVCVVWLLVGVVVCLICCLVVWIGVEVGDCFLVVVGYDEYVLGVGLF